MQHRPPLLLTCLWLGLAAILLIMPLPHWAHALRPQWVMLLALVWSRFYRNHVSLFCVFMIGLFVDLLLGTMLGQHAFVYVLVVYWFCQYYQRIVHFPLLQQTVCIALLVLLGSGVQWLLAFCFADNVPSLMSLLSVLTTAVLWPWLMMLLAPNYASRTSNYAR